MQNKIDLINYRIKKTERIITIIEYKRQRKYLKQKGFRVKIEYPPKIFDAKFENKKQLVNVNENEDEYKSESESESESEDEDVNDTKKELITVDNTTQPRITKLVGLEITKNPSITLQNHQNLKTEYLQKLEEYKKLLDGKKTTANFFTNMMDKIKKLKDKHNKNNDDDDDEDEDDEDADNCTICLGDITGDDVGVLKCGHLYCFQCIKEYIVKNPKCPICRKDVKQNDLTMISFEKPNPAETKELKDKQDLIAKIGTKLANLVLYIKSLNEKCIIFSQWDDMLKNVGDTLDTYNIKNVFCRGNVWTRDKAIRTFTSDHTIKAIMLSSGSAAAGTNLTAASTVILLDPVYKESQDGTMGSYEFRRNVEWQAIGRAYRTGQTKKVTVVRMIIKDSVEEEIYKKNKQEDGKYKDNKNLIDKLLEVNDESINITNEEMKKLNKDGEEKAKLKEAKKPIKKAVKQVVKQVDEFDSD
jgi:SNF2 family DNA or RNA helicase